MADDNPTEVKTEESSEFKKPVLIGRVGKLPKKVKNESESVEDEKPLEKPPEKPRESTSENVNKSSLPPAVLLKEISTPIPYREPKWSGLCPDGSNYSLEVLKSGMIVERVDLTKKSFYVFGRLANCDVVMAHPTISRHHSVLQYKAFAEDGEPSSGWYLYDLGSTHGTYLNKDRLKQSHYVRVRVGHQIKFGNSTRTYIMEGPDFDCEGESELTVTEIKQKAEEMRVERDRAIQEAKEQREREKLEEEKRLEEEGINWGMSEDAEEEPDLSDNPFAATTHEELFIADPKKTLRGYFEREGLELVYDCREGGHSQYICRVELPLTDGRGRPIIAEAIHSGKKKEAVVACAAEACRVLDRHGVLRQATHEPRRRKRPQDDEYDSDSDTFLDRTGTVEERKQARKREGGDGPLTYTQLLEKITALETQISTEEAALERLRSTNKHTDTRTDSQADPLDEYMSSLSAGGYTMAVKADISKAKMKIQKLKSELSKTQHLADIARPADMPPLIKRDDNRPAVKMNNSVVYGKRIKLKSDSIKKPTPKLIKKEEGEFVEEMDSDDEQTETTTTKKEKEITSENTNTKDQCKSDIKDCKSDPKEGKSDLKQGKSDIKEGKSDTNACKSEPKEGKSDPKVCKSEKVYGPMRPPENYVIPEDYFNQESDRDLPEIMEKDE